VTHYFFFLAAFFFAGAFFLALLVAFFLMAIATSSWASDQEAAACALSTIPGENPQPPSTATPPRGSIEAWLQESRDDHRFGKVFLNEQPCFFGVIDRVE
jgi:hypothetical protein